MLPNKTFVLMYMALWLHVCMACSMRDKLSVLPAWNGLSVLQTASCVCRCDASKLTKVL